MDKYKQTRKALEDLLAWSTSSARYQSTNPYCIPVIKNAMQTLATIDGLESYLDLPLDTAKYNKQ
jgi:hypothetical protein